MPKFIHSLVSIFFCFAISGCMLNSVRSLPNGGIPSGDRAVLIFGVEIAESFIRLGLKTELAEYNISKRNISGSCFRFNRAEVSIDVNRQETRYFAFDVPAGAYVLSPFSSFRVNEAKQNAFVASPGSTVYVGTYKYYSGLRMALERDLPTRLGAIQGVLPNLGDVRLAEIVVVDTPTLFMCTP